MKITWECKELTVSVSCKEDRIEENGCSFDMKSCADLLANLIDHMNFGKPEYILALCLEWTSHDYDEESQRKVDQLRLDMFRAAEVYRISIEEELESLHKRVKEMNPE